MFPGLPLWFFPSKNCPVGRPGKEAKQMYLWGENPLQCSQQKKKDALIMSWKYFHLHGMGGVTQKWIHKSICNPLLGCWVNPRHWTLCLQTKYNARSHSQHANEERSGKVTKVCLGISKSTGRLRLGYLCLYWITTHTHTREPTSSVDYSWCKGLKTLR